MISSAELWPGGNSQSPLNSAKQRRAELCAGSQDGRGGGIVHRKGEIEEALSTHQ